MLTVNKTISILLLSTVLTLYSAHVQANEFCADQSELASSIMKLRQMGVPVSKMMKAANTSSDPQLRNVLVSYTELAYERVRYSTKEYQHKAVVDFGTEVYNMCKRQFINLSVRR